ncbi:MAG TPA: hypothetical protein VJB12_02290 [Candidatus Nanoarchaeia archaeon]|nr:hypothetical protein [Candidatus Nanoarchaeia archaeon]
MAGKIVGGILFAFTLLIVSPFAYAQEEPGDFEIAGLELEKLLNLGSGLLAAGLFIATAIAYQRTGNKRLPYVSAAFLLFAIKGFLTSHELFMEEWPFVDPFASALNFAIILCFFIGIVKK